MWQGAAGAATGGGSTWGARVALMSGEAPDGSLAPLCTPRTARTVAERAPQVLPPPCAPALTFNEALRLRWWEGGVPTAVVGGGVPIAVVGGPCSNCSA